MACMMKQAVLRGFSMHIGHLLQQRGRPGETLIESAGCRSFRLHSHFKTNLIFIVCKDSQKREWASIRMASRCR